MANVTASGERRDGLETKARLIEAAGQLIAHKGYAQTTAKEIAARAKTNTAAVNYHFGGRDGLYRAVMAEVHRRLMNQTELERIASSEETPREKLAALLDLYLRAADSANGWALSAWLHELLAPPPCFADILRQNCIPKQAVVLGIFAEYTGRKLDDPQLYGALLAFFAPFFLVIMGGETPIEYGVLLPTAPKRAALLAMLKKAAFAALDACKQET